MKKFNVNEHIYIQITEDGWEHLKKYHNRYYVNSLKAMRRVEIDGEYWYRIQCWEAFDLFPSGLGMPVYFKRNIMFDDVVLIDCDEKEDE